MEKGSITENGRFPPKPLELNPVGGMDLFTVCELTPTLALPLKWGGNGSLSL